MQEEWEDGVMVIVRARRDQSASVEEPANNVSIRTPHLIDDEINEMPWFGHYCPID